jgi:hypothetical protein
MSVAETHTNRVKQGLNVDIWERESEGWIDEREISRSSIEESREDWDRSVRVDNNSGVGAVDRETRRSSISCISCRIKVGLELTGYELKSMEQARMQELATDLLAIGRNVGVRWIGRRAVAV